jgi:hypothetical protein
VAVPLFSAVSRAALSPVSWVASSFDVDAPVAGVVVVVPVVVGVDAAPAEKRFGASAPPMPTAATSAGPRTRLRIRLMELLRSFDDGMAPAVRKRGVRWV